GWRVELRRGEVRLLDRIRVVGADAAPRAPHLLGQRARARVVLLVLPGVAHVARVRAGAGRLGVLVEVADGARVLPHVPDGAGEALVVEALRLHEAPLERVQVW